MQLLGKKKNISFSKKETNHLVYRLHLLKYSRYSYIQNIGLVISNRQDKNLNNLKLDLELMLKTKTQQIKFLYHMFAIEHILKNVNIRQNNEKQINMAFLDKFKLYINTNFFKFYKINYDIFSKEIIKFENNAYFKIYNHLSEELSNKEYKEKILI